MRERDVSFGALAAELDLPLVWVAAAVFGQHAFTAADAAQLIGLLGLPAELAAGLEEVPTRGALDAAVPVDPTVYRLYEIVQVYGPALKALIVEEFGDGIMSAINFKLDIGRTNHDGADHVVITFDGKFLPYDWPTD